MPKTYRYRIHWNRTSDVCKCEYFSDIVKIGQ